jgi:phosphatidylserine decarboxylase
VGQSPLGPQTEPVGGTPAADRGTSVGRLPLEPMDPGITSIQPGGGVCMRLELAWGRLRRWYLRRLRPGYVARMRRLRRGKAGGCPYEPLDPRDVKFFRNQGGYDWAPEDDPFAWRDRLPFVRAGLAELLIFSGPLFLAAVSLALVDWRLAWIPALLGLFPAWFFRDPKRTPPAEAGLVVSPADGRVVSVEEVADDDYVGGPAVVISIFLSVLNVHINRAPLAARVIGLTYRPGKFFNAQKPASARENEQVTVRLEESASPYRRMIVRQIAGAVARRIVCWVRPGEALERGAQFGMIKFGSRTELVLPREPGLVVEVRRGQKVKAGTSVLARYRSTGESP